MSDWEQVESIRSDGLDGVSPMEWDSLRNGTGPKVVVHKRPRDNVATPHHYVNGGVECIEYIRQQLGDTHRAYLEGNVLKYMHRHKLKGKPLEDLRKARVYLNWLIGELENEGK